MMIKSKSKYSKSLPAVDIYGCPIHENTGAASLLSVDSSVPTCLHLCPHSGSDDASAVCASDVIYVNICHCKHTVNNTFFYCLKQKSNFCGLCGPMYPLRRLLLIMQPAVF